jgi:hypothetical protein
MPYVGVCVWGGYVCVYHTLWCMHYLWCGRYPYHVLYREVHMYNDLSIQLAMILGIALLGYLGYVLWFVSDDLRWADWKKGRAMNNSLGIIKVVNMDNEDDVEYVVQQWDFLGRYTVVGNKWVKS